MEKDTIQKRYEIIEPFLNKEQKLKKISKEKNIPYSTLKRWVKNFKKNGMIGLDNLARSDKNTYRSINNNVEDFIENTYNNNPEMKIREIYDRSLEYIKGVNEKKISYNTVYRIVNNLDPFMKNFINIESYKSEYSNERFEYVGEKVDISVLDEINDMRKDIYINLIYDSYSKAIASFSISFEKLKLDEILLLLRKAILKKSKEQNFVFGVPDEFLINDFYEKDKKKILKVSKELNIKIECLKGKEEKLECFYSELKTRTVNDIYMYREIKCLLNNYILKDYNLDNERRYYEKWNENLKIFKRVENERILDELLLEVKSKRIIHEYGIRFQNLIYNNIEKFKSIKGELVTIKYDVFDMSKIRIYYEDVFFCDARCWEMEGKFDLQELKSDQQLLKIKYYGEIINMANLQEELREIIIQNIKENEKLIDNSN